MRFTRAIRAFAAGSVIAGGIVLGVAGVAGAWPANAVATPQTGCATSAGISVSLVITPSGSDVGTGTIHFQSSGATVSPALPSQEGTSVSYQTLGSNTFVFNFPVADAGEHVYVSASVGWPGDNASYSSQQVTLPVGCPNVPPAPTVTVVAGSQCGVYVATVNVTAPNVDNGYEGSTGPLTITATGSGVAGAVLPAIDVPPGGVEHGGVTFPVADAGKSETVTVSGTYTGSFSGNGAFSVSESVTVPATCPVTPPTTPPTTPTPPPAPPTTPAGPCAVPTNVGCPGYVAPSSPAAPAATPAPAAHVVPVGAPQTGFGGAAQSNDDGGLLIAGGGLFAIAAAALFLIRRRRTA